MKALELLTVKVQNATFFHKILINTREMLYKRNYCKIETFAKISYEINQIYQQNIFKHTLLARILLFIYWRLFI